tara:strand:- start:439 stop:966 length:528 start_codon:yes stop_codon:yes gene_type:complete
MMHEEENVSNPDKNNAPIIDGVSVNQQKTQGEIRQIIASVNESGEIDTILASKEDAGEDERYPNATIYILEYGRKRLRITFKKDNDVVIHIENRSGNTNRMANETTIIYMAAEKLMQEHASSTGHTLSYTLITKNINIAEWAKTSGMEIFQWDDQGEYSDGDHPMFYAQCTIHGG